VGQPKQRNPLQNHGATATRSTEQRSFVRSTHQLPYREIDGQLVSGFLLIVEVRYSPAPKYAVASWPLPNGAGVCKTMIMIALRGVLMGAVFPLTGFSEMPKAGSTPQQAIQQTPQQPVQQIPQPQSSVASIPPELIPRLHNISRDQIAAMRAMQARLSGTGRNIGDLPGATFQPGNIGPATQQLPPGVSLEMIQALAQRRQDGSG